MEVEHEHQLVMVLLELIYFGPPVTPNGITATGGGAGGMQPFSPGTANDGGSGGASYSSGTPYIGLGNTPPTSPPQGK